MSEKINKQIPENDIAYRSFDALFRAMESKYPSLTEQQFLQAVSRTRLYSMYTANPFIQNKRVKSISSLPHNYGKNEITEMLLAPNNSEKGLREVSNALTYTAYPFFKLIKTAADILTYRYYSYPKYAEESDIKTQELKREWRLVDKISDTIKPTSAAHEAAGIALRDGKVFYLLRHDVDKSHNAVNYCFLQQLPQDWVKIVGFNNITKYTVAFNLFYFAQPGTDARQFGDTFLPYMEDFNQVAAKKQGRDRTSRRSVYSAFTGEAKQNAEGSPDVYFENGRWFYWVTLPADAVWTFEIDDISRNVITPFAGLILSMAQIAQYENLQLELLANPLVSVLTGEMEYRDDSKSASMGDAYKLSPSGRDFFEALWYQMLSANNTGGIGFYAAPLKNIKLQQLADAPSATEISSNGYSYVIQKSGNGLLPMNDEPRAGMVAYSAMIESRYARPIYRTFETMMNYLYKSIGLKYEWRFRMFGDIFSEKDQIEDARKGMTLGILLDTLKYDALMGHSLLEDLSISNLISGSGVLNKRLPLVNSYSMKQESSGLPPQAQIDEGGRPETEISESGNENQEATIDAR